MTDYISREAAIEALCGYCNGRFGEDACEPPDCSLYGLLNRIPAADVREVKRGKWENELKTYKCSFTDVCSKCGKRRIRDHYCSNCGADMRGTDDV